MYLRSIHKLVPFVLLAAAATVAHADVRVTTLFADHMVLQRELPVPIWGTADLGEKVTVQFGKSQVVATPNGQGKWMAKLPPQKASGVGQELVIKGTNTLTFKDVLVGDVWVCSGQSNMEMNLGGCNAPEDIASANLPKIRRIKFDHRALATPTTEVPGHWEVCTPGTAGGFTAVGLYFARRIQKETDLPIGLIDDNWGGTRIEPWVPKVGFELEPNLAQILTNVKKMDLDYRQNLRITLDAVDKWTIAARQALAAGSDVPPAPSMPQNPLADAGQPMSLYNGMIAPLAPYGIKGALWYQGESNGGESDEYYYKMNALIGGWRKVWNQGEFPFYFVQLANLGAANDNPEGGDGWAKVRMAQVRSLTIPHTGMATIFDIGEANDIHPKNKFDVGERLALWALRNEYGKPNLTVSGPLYKSLKVEGNKIRIAFDSVGRGLMVGKKEGRKPTQEVTGGTLKRFAIAGADKKWYWANATIDGPTVVVSCPSVPSPVAVRYAFTMNPEGANLYNKEGLPASPFRTDEW